MLKKYPDILSSLWFCIVVHITHFTLGQLVTEKQINMFNMKLTPLEDRIDADLSEINRLEEVYHEIADIQDYLHAQIQPYNNQFDSIQR